MDIIFIILSRFLFETMFFLTFYIRYFMIFFFIEK